MVFSHKIFGGEKKQWVIAFYGYGQSASVFEPLYDLFRETHNLLVIDNPMKDYDKDILPDDLKKYIDRVLHTEGIEQFSTISYSMGSRLNLWMPIFYPTQLERLVLVAPDGIRINFWNKIAVDTMLGRSLFKLFVHKEGLYVSVLEILYQVRILNKSLFAFSKWNMRNLQQRKSVYNAWMNMRCLVPDLKKSRTVLERNNIGLISYFGKNDAVIPLKNYRKCKKAFPKGQHNLVEGEHDFMNEDFFAQIKDQLIKR